MTFKKLVIASSVAAALVCGSMEASAQNPTATVDVLIEITATCGFVNASDNSSPGVLPPQAEMNFNSVTNDYAGADIYRQALSAYDTEPLAATCANGNDGAVYVTSAHLPAGNANITQMWLDAAGVDFVSYALFLDGNGNTPLALDNGTGTVGDPFDIVGGTTVELDVWGRVQAADVAGKAPGTYHDTLTYTLYI